jgi:hypothetical protein
LRDLVGLRRIENSSRARWRHCRIPVASRIEDWDDAWRTMRGAQFRPGCPAITISVNMRSNIASPLIAQRALASLASSTSNPELSQHRSADFGHDRVVLDQQHQSTVNRVDSLLSRPGLRIPARERGRCNACTLPQFAVDRSGTAGLARERVDLGQSEPTPLPAPLVVKNGSNTLEQDILRNTSAVVGHRQRDEVTSQIAKALSAR